MKGIPRRVAIWVDHRRAVLVALKGPQIVQEESIESKIDQEAHHAEWSRSHLQAHKHEHLEHFFEDVVRHIEPADEIVILGPGPAKRELRHHIEQKRSLRGNVIAVESAQRLKTQEIVELALAVDGGSDQKAG